MKILVSILIKWLAMFLYKKKGRSTYRVYIKSGDIEKYIEYDEGHLHSIEQ